MKTLNNEQQQELQELLAVLDESNLPLTVESKAQIAYWRGELKPKRVRRSIKEILTDIS